MPPQQSVQLKNKVACTAALLHNMEHGANSFNLGNNKDDWFAAPSFIVVTADHSPRRDEGVPLGRRICRSGLEVVDAYPKQTRRMPMAHDTTLGHAAIAAQWPKWQRLCQTIG
jgi:hypothetical protein